MRLYRQERAVRTVPERPRQRQLPEQPTVLDLPATGEDSFFLLVVGHAMIKRHRKRLSLLLALTHTQQRGTSQQMNPPLSPMFAMISSPSFLRVRSRRRAHLITMVLVLPLMSPRLQ